MTHSADLGTQSISYTQRFAIQFEYPVHFTRGLFKPDNPILTDTVGRLEPSKRHRVMTFIDNAVASAIPTLSSDIASSYVADMKHAWNCLPRRDRAWRRAD